MSILYHSVGESPATTNQLFTYNEADIHEFRILAGLPFFQLLFLHNDIVFLENLLDSCLERHPRHGRNPASNFHHPGKFLPCSPCHFDSAMGIRGISTESRVA
jgi:hypothetical protein